ncbi:Protein of unknown function [Glycomyces sambucus]|uniref:DUF2975 domain-containing protein n=1 Tax=Glycomyces sambucus TaxID=380244 RepID=A0A1G9LY52_9ACTN|nr:DUF2975 domain-containing protein [Glycomyces sambucus]SDL66918.1 Protein of unknown function [Glycomyces sambucus]
MNAFLILMLRMALAAAFLAGLFGQVMVVPNSLAEDVTNAYGPEMATALVPAAIAGIACVQVVLVATWRLLGMIDGDAIFSERSFRWVDVVVWAALAAMVIALLTAAYIFVFGSGADEMRLLGDIGGLVVCAGGGAAFAMFTLIMKGLLRKATELRTEMAGVV